MKIQELSTSNSSFTKDSDNYFQVSIGPDGNGSAIVRFLPPLPDEEFPFVQIYNHAFQGQGGKWFIDNCPTTLKRPCPVCEANNLLYRSGDEAQKKLASSRKRKMYYVSNLLVVKDPRTPANEGKVFLFKYGVRIFDKLKEMLLPEFDDHEPVDIFDPQEGANFRLRVTKTGSFPEYDRSTFDQPSPLGDDKMIAEVLRQSSSLEAIIHPNNFKLYEELKSKLETIVGQTSGATAA
ncbi:MAG: single-stranded DNA-binding protein [Bryobacteraceae bacterium]